MKVISLICSLQDDAGVNIKDRLLEAKEWSKVELPTVEMMADTLKSYPVTQVSILPDETVYSNFLTAIYELKQNDVLFRLFALDGRLLFQDEIDKRLSAMGFECDLIVFLSKHKSKSETKSLTVHPTGNCSDAVFGGYPFEVNVPAPLEMKKLLLHMDRIQPRLAPDYDVTFEVTHHGPTKLFVPSLFIEIGSMAPEWNDKAAGIVVAEAVLSLADLDDKKNNESTSSENNANNASDNDRISKEKELLKNPLLAVAFGGSHYGERQTALIFKTRIAFGHMFPKYQLESLTQDVIVQAFEKTKTKTAYFDKNSMKSESRRYLTEILERHGISILNDKDVKEGYGAGFDLRENE